METEKVAECFFGGVAKFQNKDIDAVIPIPQLLPVSNGMYCNVIQISYELKVEVNTQGCHMDIDLVMPIVIGTVPIVMNPSFVQPTFNAPAFENQPVQPYSDIPAVNYQQNTAGYPPSNGAFNYAAPPPNFNPGYAAPYPASMVLYDQREKRLPSNVLIYLKSSFQLRPSIKQ